MVTKLTNGFVKRVECKSGLTKEEIYDDILKGFLLEIKSNNRKTFYLKLQTTSYPPLEISKWIRSLKWIS